MTSRFFFFETVDAFFFVSQLSSLCSPVFSVAQAYLWALIRLLVLFGWHIKLFMTSVRIRNDYPLLRYGVQVMVLMAISAARATAVSSTGPPTVLATASSCGKRQIGARVQRQPLLKNAQL